MDTFEEALAVVGEQRGKIAQLKKQLASNLEDLDSARDVLVVAKSERAELLRELSETQRALAEVCRERDAARAALVELLAGLSRDDEPRRRAVDAALAVVASWEGEP